MPTIENGWIERVGGITIFPEGGVRPPWKPGETNEETALRFGVRLYSDEELSIWRSIDDEAIREEVRKQQERITANRLRYYQGLLERKLAAQAERSPQIKTVKSKLRELKTPSRHKQRSHYNTRGKLTRDPSGNPMGRPRIHPVCLRYGSHRFNQVTGRCPCGYVRPSQVKNEGGE